MFEGIFGEEDRFAIGMQFVLLADVALDDGAVAFMEVSQYF